MGILSVDCLSPLRLSWTPHEVWSFTSEIWTVCIVSSPLTVRHRAVYTVGGIPTSLLSLLSTLEHSLSHFGIKPECHIPWVCFLSMTQHGLVEHLAHSGCEQPS
jgi:hypothetical protein